MLRKRDINIIGFESAEYTRKLRSYFWLPKIDNVHEKEVNIRTRAWCYQIYTLLCVWVISIYRSIIYPCALTTMSQVLQKSKNTILRYHDSAQYHETANAKNQFLYPILLISCDRKLSFFSSPTLMAFWST